MPTRRVIPRTQGYFEVRRSPIQGLGAFALTRIPKGTRIIEYTGERITHAESDRRYDDAAMKRHTTYLFVVSSRTVIDATVQGNEAKYINHSCAPNCESVSDKSRIFIEARRAIEPGEELVYDYRFERTGEPDEEKRYRCVCGAAKCRGTILVPKKVKRAKNPTGVESAERVKSVKSVKSAKRANDAAG